MRTRTCHPEKSWALKGTQEPSRALNHGSCRRGCECECEREFEASVDAYMTSSAAAATVALGSALAASRASSNISAAVSHWPASAAATARSALRRAVAGIIATCAEARGAVPPCLSAEAARRADAVRLGVVRVEVEVSSDSAGATSWSRVSGRASMGILDEM